jgi:hypothetical protein
MRYVCSFPLNLHHEDRPKADIFQKILIPLGILRPAKRHILKQDEKERILKHLLVSNYSENEMHQARV